MDLIKELFKSKKFVVAIGTALGTVAIKMGAPEGVHEMIPWLVGLAASYIVGQSISDHQKEKTKIEISNRSSGQE